MSDVVILGAGPAGLTLGCYLARAGVSTLILEKALHPRPHVGESLMPSVVPIFRDIGFLPVLDQGHFPRSHGVAYHAGDRSAAFRYAEFPMEGAGQAHTYHADRAKLDLLFMKHAQNAGCRIAQGVAVRRILFDGERAVGVKATLGDVEVEIPARVVVDAAGRHTLVGRQLDLRRAHPVSDRFALHAWYQGVDRGPHETAGFTHVHLLPEVGGWAWQAPIDATITSVGVVAEKDAFHRGGRNPEAFVDGLLATHGSLARACRDAERINQLQGEVNYSYALERVCGNGWLAVGDAALFLDPVFGTGVAMALQSAKAAAGRIAGALEEGRTERTAFLPYETGLARVRVRLDRLVRLFYRRPRAFLELAGSDVHREGVLRLLQGDFGDAADATLDALEARVERDG